MGGAIPSFCYFNPQHGSIETVLKQFIIERIQGTEKVHDAKRGSLNVHIHVLVVAHEFW